MSCRTGELFMDVKMQGRKREFKNKDHLKKSHHRQERSRGMVFQMNTCRILTHLRLYSVIFSSLRYSDSLEMEAILTGANWISYQSTSDSSSLRDVFSYPSSHAQEKYPFH